MVALHLVEALRLQVAVRMIALLHVALHLLQEVVTLRAVAHAHQVEVTQVVAHHVVAAVVALLAAVVVDDKLIVTYKRFTI